MYQAKSLCQAAGGLVNNVLISLPDFQSVGFPYNEVD